MPRPLTIVVGGYIVAYPLGGMTWHHLNYLLGLHEMGHEAWFLEDSGAYSLPYNPTNWTHDIDSTYGRRYLEETFRTYGLPPRYCYYSQFEDKHYGLSRDQLHDLLKRADLLLCISGVTPLRPQRPRTRRTAVVDTDPVFTQLRMGENAEFAEYFRGFDAVATFGRLIGTPASPLPTHGIHWIPTSQPVALRHWPVVPTDSRAFTTIGKWEHGGRSVEFQGRHYQSSKGVEWMKLLDLPRHVPQWELDLGMLNVPREVVRQFTDHGWTISNPEAATTDCPTFQRFIQGSAGELTVAKQIYSGLPSGWFSDRSSCYLASGRPVITQDSGFDRWLPTGEGLFAFRTIDEAAAALDAISRDYPRHSAAARRIAESHFDARRVLADLLDKVL